MKIKYLGTGAAEGIPGLFCNCGICKQAAQNGGRDIRTRSQVLIGDNLLVDFPPDSYMHKLQYNIDFSKVETVLFTHAHPDHLYAEDFGRRGWVFAHDMTSPKVNIVFSQKSKEIFDALPAGKFRPVVSDAIIPHIAEPYVTLALGEYSIIPLPARHAETLGGCLIYLITQGNKTMLYANDTGLLFDESFVFLKDIKIDLVSFDCTLGREKDGTNHMGLSDNIEFFGKLRETGAVDDKTQVVITHFSHNGKMLHKDLEKAASPYGFMVAYDGFEIEI